MKLNSYPVNVHDENTYWFISSGRTGSIFKVVLFQELQEGERVNPAMGDVNKITGEIDFEGLSNNGDARKVFFTIADVVRNYTRSYPEKEIFIAGNTIDKKRIYSIMISTYLEEISSDFYVWGGNTGKSFELFVQGKIYDAIMIKRKKKDNLLMKSNENHIVRDKKNGFVVKPFPVKLIKGKSVEEKLSHAKSVSASITDFKETK